MKNLFLLFALWGTASLLGQKPVLVVPIGHTKDISSVAFSPNGKSILTGSHDNTAILWNLERREIKRFEEHSEPVTSVAFSPNGQFILTGSPDRTAILWDLEGQIIKRFEGHSGPVWSVAFSPNGQFILTGSGDGTAILWDLEGQKIKTFEGHSELVWSVAFSPNGQFILTGSFDGTAILWDLEGQKIKTFEGHSEQVWSVAFSPNGQFILTGSFDGTAILWDLEGQKIKTFEGHSDRITSVAFSPNGQFILTGSWENSTAILWDLEGQKIKTFEGHSKLVWSVAFSPNGQFILTGSKDRTAILWDLGGQIIKSFEGHSHQVTSVACSPNGQFILIGSWENSTAILWDLEGREPKSFEGHSDWIRSVAFSPNGQFILTGSPDRTAILWDLEGQIIKIFEGHSNGVTSVAFSPNGQFILTGSRDDTAILWDLEGQIIKTFEGHSNIVTSVAFSPNGQFILTGSRDDTAILWDLEGQIIKTFEGYSNIVTSVAFSPNGQFILTGSWNGTAILWDLEGQKIKSFEGHSNEVTSVAFSPNGQFILTGSWDGTAILWDLEGQKIKSFEGHSNEVTSVAFSPKGQFILTGSKDNTQKLWSTTVQLNDASKPKELATLVAIDTSDWIVTTPDGLFDASPGAMNWMHYSVFDQKNREYLAIELEQLKARYYEPGLLQKILGNTNEGLRPVENFDTVALYPKIKLAQIDSTGTLQLQLSERNGGIGKVSLFINGKEVEEEANPLPRRENAQRDSSIQIDLSKYRNYLFRHPDSTNTVSIRVYNEAGWLKSPAFNLEYQVAAARSRGGEGTGNNSSWTGKFDPKLYVITIGTSDYSGTKLDLQYGDQDATMMARAFQAVGTALLEADSLEVHCLTTARADSTGLEGTPIAWHNAGKNDIRSVFDKIKNQAKAEDIVVVYLSGHGVTQGGTDQTLFYYLTKDIASEDALSDPATRRAYAISSEELTDWLKAIPALKQVLIIDACNSGQIVENLTGGTKALNSSQIRALDRMQDRTGMFVLSGSAADKVSYEASEYGQGLLTYALLEGMRSATRSVTDGKEMVKMIDVMTLFQYARDRVPELATSINGIQTPMLGFPSRAASFDIGILNDQASVAIPITKGKPIMIRSTFLNEATYRDDLRLADSLEAAFREETKKGADADLVYVDVYDYPNAYSLGGFYRQRADGIALKLRLLHGDEAPVTLEIPVTEDLEKLVKLIVRAVKKEIP